MKPKSALLVCTLFAWLLMVNSLSAQVYCPDYEFAQSPGVGTAAGIAVDAQGNTYMTGTFTGTANFGSLPPLTTASASAGFYVAKMNASGQWQWAIKGDGTNLSIRSFSIAIDASGNSYVVGSLTGTATLGNSTISGSPEEGFVAKISPSGQWLWATATRTVSLIGISLGSNKYAIAADSLGNSFVTGIYHDTCRFGSTTLVATGHQEMFVAKMNTTGQWQWATKVGATTTGNTATGIAIDRQGNSYVTGYISSGTSTFGSSTLTTTSGSTLFVGKANNSGQWVWAVKPTNGNGSYGYGIAADGIGNSYIVAKTLNITNFDTIQVPNGYGVVVAKLNNAGQWLWAVKSPGIAIIQAKAIALDKDGSAYVVGSYQNAAVFGNTTLDRPANSGSDIFTAKISTDGQWLMAIKATGQSTEQCTAIGVDSLHNCYIGGTIDNNANFGRIQLLNSSGFSKFFVAKIVAPTLELTASPNATINCGDSAQFSAVGLGYHKATWVPTNGLSDANTLNPKASPTQTTTYTLTASDTCGNSISRTTTVTVNTYTIAIGASATNIVCGNASTLTATGSSNTQTLYSWSPSTGLSNTSIQNPTANPTATSTYTVSALTINGCSASNTVTISVTPYTVSASATPTNIACGNTTTLSATPSAGAASLNYQWTPAYRLSNANVANPTAKPGTNTTYTVRATTANGCIATDSISIIVTNTNPPVPVIASTSGSFGLCDGGTQLDAGSGFAGYTWNTGETTQTISANALGTYSVTVDDQTGCAGTAEAEVTPLVTISAPDGTLLCSGQSSTLQLNATGGFDSYNWSDGSQTQGIQVSQPGAYSVTVTSGSCTGSVDTLVTQNNGQAIADFSYAGNGGQDVTFTAIGNGINFLSWDFGDGETSTDPTPTHTYAANGTYTVEVTITDICGQTASKAKSITVPVVTGISGIDAPATEWSIYPNPTEGTFLVLESNTDRNVTNLQLYDISSRLIPVSLSQKSTGKFGVALPQLVPGIYVMHITDTKGKSVSIRFLVN